MKKRWGWIALIAIAAIILGMVQTADAFMGRKYTMREVIWESTNIFFGTIASVDRENKRAVVKLEESIRGRSNPVQMKINVSPGEWRGNETSPDKLMRALKVNKPVVIFVRRHGQALGHAGGMWFQMVSGSNSLSSDVWWNFTHIGVRLNRGTYSGSTKKLQQNLLRLLKPFKYAEPDDIKVLFFAKRRSVNEFNTLSSFKSLVGRGVVYKPTRAIKPTDLEQADVLWIGYRSIPRISSGNELFNDEAEERIRMFVENGGIVILSGQDSDPEHPCQIGFLPEPMTGVERKAGSGIQPVLEHDLFTTPKEIQIDSIRVDDAWKTASENYSVLAFTLDGHIAAAKMDHGKGIYIIAAMQNGHPTHIKKNAPLMRNLMYQAVSFRSGIRPISQ